MGWLEYARTPPKDVTFDMLWYALLCEQQLCTQSRLLDGDASQLRLIHSIPNVRCYGKGRILSETILKTSDSEISSLELASADHHDTLCGRVQRGTAALCTQAFGFTERRYSYRRLISWRREKLAIGRPSWCSTYSNDQRNGAIS